jgi:hypothetical protein
MAPSLFRKRHEAEDIIPIPGPLETVSASGRDYLENLQQFEKSHKFDPNLPIDDLTDVDAAIATGNAEKGIEIEHALMEDNSPYPEVRSVVRNYDVDVPANTIRAWTIGLILCTIGSGVNMLFSLRNPSVTVTTYVVQLVAYPLGLGWDLIMPDREWTLFGLKFNLKPGKFNYKEHVVIVAMSNVCTVFLFLISITNSNRRPTVAVFSTQLMYSSRSKSSTAKSLAGLSRSYLASRLFALDMDWLDLPVAFWCGRLL